MELNLFSTDLAYPNVNVVFDDSIYQVDDDSVFVLSVNERFNAHITFPSYANEVRIGGNPSNYNQPLNIPSNVQNIHHCFNKCYNFNQPVVIPANVKNCSNMFSGCYIFNQPVTIPNKVTDCSGMFTYCYNFNQPVTIPASVNACSSMFQFTNYNNQVTIENGVSSTAYLFSTTLNYNCPVTIPDSVRYCHYMFLNSQNFNSDVTLGNSVRNCEYMFNGCYNFNRPVKFPSSVINMYCTFSRCSNFNQPVVIPNGVNNARSMFEQCNNFNSYVIVPQTVEEASYMFSGLGNMKAPVYLFANNMRNYPQGTYYMFNGCNAISNVYITGVYNNQQLNRFMRNNGSVRCNIYSDDASIAQIKNTTILVNGGKPTWTDDATNGYTYNATMNLYIYNNWNGSIPNFCRLSYFSKTFNSEIYTEYLEVGKNGTYTYGSNEWSNVPGGQPIAGILNNIRADMNVFYVGAFEDYWIKQKYKISNYVANNTVGSYHGDGMSGDAPGIIFNGTIVAGVAYRYESGAGFIQSGKLYNDGSLPSVQSNGYRRITYSGANNGWWTGNNTNEDIYLCGANYNIKFAITFREGNVPDNGLRVLTHSNGGGDAALNIQWGNNSPSILNYGDASTNVSFAGMLNIKYPYSSGNWGAIATRNITDGINNYNAGDLVRQWSYSAYSALTVYNRD